MWNLIRGFLEPFRLDLGTGQPLGKKCNLPGVMGFVFADMEPFSIDIYLVVATELLCIG